MKNRYAQNLVAGRHMNLKGNPSGELLTVGVNIHTEGRSKEVELHEYTGRNREKQIEETAPGQTGRENNRESEPLTLLELKKKRQKPGRM